MANDYYNATGKPVDGDDVGGTTLPDEFASIEDLADKLPPLTGNAGLPLQIKATAALGFESVTVAAFRTTLGLGVANNVTFANVTATGDLTVNDGTVVFTQTGTGARAFQVNHSPTGATSQNSFLVNASNGDVNGTVFRVHHETPDANQILLALDTGVGNDVKFSVDEDGDVTVAGDITAASMQSGTTQGGAGASAGEMWFDTDDDNTIKMGV